MRLLARAADGSMRDALSLTDQAIAYSANQVNEEAVRGMLGALDQSYLIRLLDALAEGDGAAVLSVADEMALRSLSFSSALQDLASLLHRIAWAQFAPSSVLDEWPEAADLRRFAETLSAEQVQLFYQIATIGRSELGLAPDEYAGFTMTLLRMLAFEPAPTGGGGAAGPGRQAGQTGASGGKRVGTPAVAAAGLSAADAAPPVRLATGPRGAVSPAEPAREPGPVAGAAGGAPASAGQRQDVARSTQAVSASRDVAQHTAQEPVPIPNEANTPPTSARVDVPAPAAGTSAASERTTARALAPWDDEPAASAANQATAPSAVDAASASASVPAEPAPTPASANTPAAHASESTSAETASLENTPPVTVSAPAAAAFARASEAATAADSNEAAQPAPATLPDAPPRRAGGASAALDVLRSAGLKVSSDRGRANAASTPKPAASANASPAAPKPAAPKPAAPRVVVPVPTPGAPRGAAQPESASGARASAAAAAPAQSAARKESQPNGSAVPPWDDVPPDDYVPLSASDDGYYGPPDDNYMPVFDSGPDDVRVSAPAPASTPVVDKRPLPPAVPLDPLGFKGDWPALAVDLPLKGISYQLAFNSELMALEGNTLKLNVPVPQYAEASQVAKLKSALAEKLGQHVDVQVEVGPARRTAAAHDAAMRAQRQQEAEREIGADPFVQSLIREFGASIVPGSIRPISSINPDAGPNGASSVH